MLFRSLFPDIDAKVALSNSIAVYSYSSPHVFYITKHTEWQWPRKQTARYHFTEVTEENQVIPTTEMRQKKVNFKKKLMMDEC